MASSVGDSGSAPGDGWLPDFGETLVVAVVEEVWFNDDTSAENRMKVPTLRLKRQLYIRIFLSPEALLRLQPGVCACAQFQIARCRITPT